MVAFLALAFGPRFPVPIVERHAAVSSNGRVASTTPSGTYVSGQGRVAMGGDGVEWSPDGQTLAISVKRLRTVIGPKGETFVYGDDDVVFWPSGPQLQHPYRLQRPLAWSPRGDRLAGRQADVTGVFSMPDGKALWSLGPRPSVLHWAEDGRLLEVAGSQIYLDKEVTAPRRPVVERKGMTIIDAVPTSTGATWLETDARTGGPDERPFLSETAPVRIGRWNAADGSISTVAHRSLGSFLAPSSTRRMAIPMLLRLGPDGLHGAVAGIVVEGGPRSIARLRLLMGKATPTVAEAAELPRLMGTVRKRCVVARADAGGGYDALWTDPIVSIEDGPIDLAFSPDGKWLAIARRNGTVRVAMGG